MLQVDPKWDQLPYESSSELLTLLQRCLQKDRKQRLRDIGDVLYEIEAATDRLQAPIPATTKQSSRPHVAALVALGAMAGAILGGLAVWGLVPERFSPVSRTLIDLSGSLERIETLALSPSGRELVYSANGQLYRRRMDGLESEAIPGTEGGRFPFFSPGGRSVGFFTANQLKRVDLGGGAPTVLADVADGLGGEWGPEGQILFGRIGAFGLSAVPITGGATVSFADLGDHDDLEWPEFLPGGEWVLFTDSVETGDDWSNSNIVAQSIRTGERRLVMERGQLARYSPTGHLVFGRDGWLFGVAFDPEQVSVAGQPVALVGDVAVENNGVMTKFDLVTLPPETEPARTLEFGRWDRRQDATEAVQHGTDCHEAAAG